MKTTALHLHRCGRASRPGRPRRSAAASSAERCSWRSSSSPSPASLPCGCRSTRARGEPHRPLTARAFRACLCPDGGGGTQRRCVTMRRAMRGSPGRRADDRATPLRRCDRHDTAEPLDYHCFPATPGVSVSVGAQIRHRPVWVDLELLRLLDRAQLTSIGRLSERASAEAVVQGWTYAVVEAPPVARGVGLVKLSVAAVRRYLACALREHRILRLSVQRDVELAEQVPSAARTDGAQGAAASQARACLHSCPVCSYRGPTEWRPESWIYWSAKVRSRCRRKVRSRCPTRSTRRCLQALLTTRRPCRSWWTAAAPSHTSSRAGSTRPTAPRLRPSRAPCCCPTATATICSMTWATVSSAPPRRR